MKFFLEYSPDLNLDHLEGNYDLDGIFVDASLSISTEFPVYEIHDEEIRHEGDVIGKRIVIDTAENMQKIMMDEIPNSLEFVLIETGDWHIIPIENLIAKFANLELELYATAATPESVSLLRNILELGIDGCVLQPGKYQINELVVSSSEGEREVELTELEVSSVEKIGNGDRVCVDTVSILKSGEGLLVGSTSAVQALVQAEVEDTGFVNSRPFRVNAGVVASYTLNFDKTNYLSELETGKTVMIVDREGNSRKEFIARVKIERRPLIVIKLRYNDRDFPVVLQDAETVKLITSSGSKRVDKLNKGDTVLCHISDKARHFGMEIDEFIEEK